MGVEGPTSAGDPSRSSPPQRLRAAVCWRKSKALHTHICERCRVASHRWLFFLPTPTEQTECTEADGEERKSARQRCYNESKGEASVCTEDDPICVTAEPGRTTVIGRVEK